MAIREKVIEDYLVRQVAKEGGKAIKLTSSLLRSLPDRLILLSGERIAFVECKAPGRKPTPGQVRMIAWLSSMGFIAVTLDSRPRVDAFMNFMKGLTLDPRRQISELRSNLLSNIENLQDTLKE